MHHFPIDAWATHLRRLAHSVLGDSLPDPATFADDLGHRRPVDPWLIAWRASRTGTPGPQHHPTTPNHALDVQLWRALTHPDSNTIRPDDLRDSDAPGPLQPRSDDAAIEVWTETELAALHALWWYAVGDTDSPLMQRILDTARWHLQHLQPDNATNHPWALHVFLLLNETDPNIGARHYAETLLSNCQVMLGQPDRFSALILLDSADALQMHFEMTEQSRP